MDIDLPENRNLNLNFLNVDENTFSRSNQQRENLEDENQQDEINRLRNVISTNYPAETVVSVGTVGFAYLALRENIDNAIIQHLTPFVQTVGTGMATPLAYLKAIGINKLTSYISQLVYSNANEFLSNNKMTVTVIVCGSIIVCGLIHYGLPACRRPSLLRKIKQLIDTYITQRQQEIIKESAMTVAYTPLAAGFGTFMGFFKALPVAIVGGGLAAGLASAGAPVAVCTAVASGTNFTYLSMICLDAIKMPLLVLDEQINQKILKRETFFNKQEGIRLMAWPYSPETIETFTK